MEQEGLQQHQPTVVRKIVCFGPFEADLKAGELRKRGLKVNLQELPFRLLVALLERPGVVVTREELQARLWPSGTFVDFESGLGTALKKVRETLGDSAVTPRFIETLPRRGYRFIAEVQIAEVQKVNVQRPGVEEAGPTQPSAPQVRRALNYPVAAFVAGIVVLVLAAGTAYRLFRIRPQPLNDQTAGSIPQVTLPSFPIPPKPLNDQTTGSIPQVILPLFPVPPKPLNDQDVLVLADFTNATGDSAFDGALRQALAFELERSPFLKVMDDAEVNQTLKLMSRPVGQPITNDIAHDVCVREGQKATIGGSLAGLGRTYAIALLATNCQTGATLAREEAEAEDKEHVLKAVARAATSMRAKLGESLSSIQKTERNRTKDDVTTNSLEALKAFQLGFELMAQGALNQEAIPHFQRAVELDPNFASAYFFMCLAYGNTSQFDLEAESLSKAFALIDHVSEGERLIISGWYYQRVAHDLNKAIDAYQMQVRIFPRSANGHMFLGSAYLTKGEYEKALKQLQEGGRLAPFNVIIQGRLAEAYVALDRFDEAKAVAEKTFAQKLDGPNIHLHLLQIAYIQDDQSAQAREIQWLVGKPEEIQSLNFQAVNALMHGQRRKATEIAQSLAEMARRQGVAGVQPFTPAVVDAQVGDCERARREKLPVLWLCGDVSALRIVQEQAAKNPPPNPENVGLLYQRGLAALNAGEGAEAAAEFQKILDHKGRNWGLRYSTAYLGMARGEAMAGDTARAKRAYQDFLALWKDADNDLPLLGQANKELASLR